MRVGDEDGDLGQETDGFSEVRLTGINVSTLPPRGRQDAPFARGIGIGHPQQRHAGSQDIHRMRARRDDADEGFHGTGQRPLRVQLCGEVIQLLARGQLAEQQEIGNLLERGLLGQITDRVASVPETGRALVHFAEGALARDHALKPGAVPGVVGLGFIVHTASQCRHPTFRTPHSGGAHRVVGGSASCPTTAVGFQGSLALPTLPRWPASQPAAP